MIKFIKKEKKINEDKSKKNINYFFLTRLNFAMSSILVFWILIVTFGSIVGMGYNWALFDVERWSYIVIIILMILLIMDLTFLIIIKKSKEEELISFEECDKEFIHGKKVFVFTNPKNAEGGIFSRTYITIDNNSVLRLRELMVPPEELWR